MFLRLGAARVVVWCLDGFIDQGDLSEGQKHTIVSLASLSAFVAASYRPKRAVDEWLSFNTLAIRPSTVVCRPSAWRTPPIDDAISDVGCRPSQAIAICADGLEIREAHTVGVGAVLIAKSLRGPVPHDSPFIEGPDFILFSGEDGSAILSADRTLAGYVAEVAAAFNAFGRWKGEVHATAFHFENSEDPDSPVYVCGRYFNKSDPRFALHPLSLRLINAKRYPERQANLFRRVLELWYSTLGINGTIILPVPQRPGEKPNLATMAVRSLNVTGATPDLELLACPADYPKQKEAGSYEARRENVRGAFKALRRLDGETVIVVDDITTSFSTINEARSVLIGAGARRVMPVAFAFHPPELWGGPSSEYPKCGRCGHAMVIRYRTADGEPFFACGDYEAFQTGQKHPVVQFDLAYRQICEL